MRVIFDDAEFDRIVRGSLPDCGDEHLALIVKEAATENGHPAACLTFVSQTGYGPRRVQIVVTVRKLLMALAALQGRFEYLTEREHAPADTPQSLSGHFNGVGWDAVFLERMYLIRVENGAIGIAATEADASNVARGLCGG